MTNKKQIVVKVRPRIGHAAASTFFDQFRKRNTPLGISPKSALQVQKKSSDYTNNRYLAEALLPIDVLRQTAANIVRKDLGLRIERLARLYPTVDKSRLKPIKTRSSQTDDRDLKLRAKAIKLAVAEYLSNSRKVG